MNSLTLLNAMAECSHRSRTVSGFSDMGQNMNPKLTVAVRGETHVYQLRWVSNCVLVGGEWEEGLAMDGEAFESLGNLVGVLAESPLYCYNEGGDVSGVFEDENEVAFGSWSIAV